MLCVGSAKHRKEQKSPRGGVLKWTERQHKGGKNIDIEPNTCYSLRYNKLLYEVGKQSWVLFPLFTSRVRVQVLYNNSLMEFAASGEYSFSSIKPFDLVFSRIPLSDSSCLVNSTITNNLATCLTITRVALQTAQNSFQEDYNSFTELWRGELVTNRPQHIQPKCKFSHVSIVKGQVQKDAPLGSLAIHFTVPGHGVMGLNSTTIVVAVGSLPLTHLQMLRTIHCAATTKRTGTLPACRPKRSLPFCRTHPTRYPTIVRG